MDRDIFLIGESLLIFSVWLMNEQENLLQLKVAQLDQMLPSLVQM